ncbi:putative transposable element [Trichonephila clavipes]|nr:putative transposable element [Trichonephila clavipes]
MFLANQFKTHVTSFHPQQESELIETWIFKVDNVKSVPRIHGRWTKTSDRANCKGQLALTVIGERRLRRIVCRQRSQTLAQITTQLNDGVIRTVSKWTVQCSLHRMGFGSRRPMRVHCSTFFIELHVLPGNPDLKNPIEPLWDVLEQGVKDHHTASTNFTKLWTALANIWFPTPIKRVIRGSPVHHTANKIIALYNHLFKTPLEKQERTIRSTLEVNSFSSGLHPWMIRCRLERRAIHQGNPIGLKREPNILAADLEASNSINQSCQVIYSQFGLAIHQNDHQARRRFVEWAQNEIVVVPDFHKRILFSDEAHFWLNGYVNKQNCRIWSEANPQVYVETPLHPEKLTVWCALWAGGINGSYFFKNDEGHNVTVNGDRYRAMITNFFIPELNNHDAQELWFQQDGATCHTARATIDLLKDTFGDRLISRFGLVNWPPRSCDLTSLDYFLWGYVNSLVYADKPQTLDHLEDSIRRVIADIRPQMLEKVIENWTSRLDYIRDSRGSHMPEIIFKM